MSLENNFLSKIFADKNFKYLKKKGYKSKSQEPKNSKIKTKLVKKIKLIIQLGIESQFNYFKK